MDSASSPVVRSQDDGFFTTLTLFYVDLTLPTSSAACLCTPLCRTHDREPIRGECETACRRRRERLLESRRRHSMATENKPHPPIKPPPIKFEAYTVQMYCYNYACTIIQKRPRFTTDQSVTFSLCAVSWCYAAGSAGLKRKVRFILLKGVNRASNKRRSGRELSWDGGECLAGGQITFVLGRMFVFWSFVSM